MKTLPILVDFQSCSIKIGYAFV